MGKTITSREFNRDVSAAKRAAENGPVTVTDHGKPSHVLMTYREYERLSGSTRSLADALYDPRTAHIELDIPPRTKWPERDTEL